LTMRSVVFFVVPSALVKCAASVPAQMMAVQGSGVGCDKPDWSCISKKIIDVPTPAENQVLLSMRGSSVNPIDVDLVEPDCATLLGCSDGSIGKDGSGIVLAVGSDSICSSFQVGDEVWGGAEGAYAEYAVADCRGIGLKPVNLDFVAAATIPGVGGTSFQCLTAAGLVPTAKKQDSCDH